MGAPGNSCLWLTCKRQRQVPVPPHTSPKWDISFCTVYICQCTCPLDTRRADGVLHWPSQSFPPWILKNKFTADKPPMRMEKFGPKVCEITNQLIPACCYTPFSSQATAGHQLQEQKVSLTRVYSDLELTSSLVHMEQGEEWNGVNFPTHQHPSTFNFFCCWTWLFYWETPATASELWTAGVKQQQEAGGGEGRHSKLPEGKLQFSNQLRSEGSLALWQPLLQSAVNAI